jgi:2-polyprenyl-3-methyl-5-hydroxy-6-metoxy-1,4-benzoquinol methylase
MGTTLFDDSAVEFAHSIDGLIRSGRYVRGEVFAEAVRKSVPAGGTILDYGCGPGRLSLRIARDGYHVFGVDPSNKMIAQARALPLASLGVHFDLIGSETLSEPGRFDAIVCSSVIEYVLDPVTLLREFRVALKPSGTLIISYANRPSMWRLYARLRFRNAAFRAYQHNLWTFREFRQMLHQGGFVVSHPLRVFESPFDSRRRLRWLSALGWVGTLGLVVAEAAPP